jgi:hypothetical protein
MSAIRSCQIRLYAEDGYGPCAAEATHFAVVQTPRPTDFGEEGTQYQDRAVLLCAKHASSTPAEAIGDMSDDELRALWHSRNAKPAF